MSKGSTDGPERREYVLYYDLDPSFGAYLRCHREAKGYSLRKLGEALEVPYHYLHRLETGGRAKKPPLELLEKIGMVMHRPLGEVEARAGVLRQPVPDPHWSVNERFKTLMMHANIKAPGMTEEWLESYSIRQKREIVQCLLNANRYGLDKKSLLVLLREEDLEETGEGRQRDLGCSERQK